VRDLQFAASKTTLQDFFKPLPGELKITANFPEATAEITQFEDVRKAATGNQPAGRARMQSHEL
jgi:hypothetical protein